MISPRSRSSSGIAVNTEVLCTMFSPYDNDENYSMRLNVHWPPSVSEQGGMYAAQLHVSTRCLLQSIR